MIGQKLISNMFYTVYFQIFYRLLFYRYNSLVAGKLIFQMVICYNLTVGDQVNTIYVVEVESDLIIYCWLTMSLMFLREPW